MPSNVDHIDEYIATFINKMITYKTHILHGSCEFTKSCSFCEYYEMGDVRRTAIRHMHNLLDGYLETDDATVFILREPHNLTVVQFNSVDRQPTMYISVVDKVKTSTHDILDWAILFWSLSLDSYPDKNISGLVEEHVRKRTSELREKVT